MDCNYLKDNLSIVSNLIAIISFLFIITRYIANYKYGKKCENRFKIPYNLFTFNIEIVLIQVFENILSLASIILLMFFFNFINKNDILLNMLMFSILFLYMIGTVGIIKEMNINLTREIKYSFCYDLLKFIGIYIVIPVIVILLNRFNIITTDNIIKVMIIVMIIIAGLSIIFALERYFDFEKRKYEIVKDEDGNSVAIIANSKQGFIVVDVIENNGNYKIREVGNYRIVDKVSLVNRKYGIINV